MINTAAADDADKLNTTTLTGTQLPEDEANAEKTTETPRTNGIHDDDDDGRGDGNDGAPQAFLPDEKLTLEDAVWIYTAGGAVAASEEVRLGALRPGFLADMTIVEVDGGGQALLDDARCVQGCGWKGRGSVGGTG